MKRKALRHGYTTGACAAAAAKGSALMLRDRLRIEQVTITLPSGEAAVFRLQGQEIGMDRASCFVIKDAGDDPDVTNGAEIHATVMLKHPVGADPCVCLGRTHGFTPTELAIEHLIVEGGPGVGRVTKPGLAVPVGEWAINPVPRRMITDAVAEVFSPCCPLPAARVVISIPNGAELAKKTLNARLGIIGGLSILGTTGIVRPISTQAWTDTIAAAIDVALACGCETVVLSTGRTSEITAQCFFSRSKDKRLRTTEREIHEGSDPLPFSLCPLPAESFVMMGDHVGFAVQACARKGVKNLVLAGQFAKLLKIACGHEQTHVSSSRLDLRTLADWLQSCPHVSRLTSHALRAGTAREILEVSGNDRELISLVCVKAAEFARKLAPGLGVKVFLAGHGGEVLYYGPNSR